LWGGEGKDVFVFKGGWGGDAINDFADGEDVIALDDVAYAQLDQAIDNAVQNGADVVLASMADP
jgi:Ca2+-binding RTX toxin-like protein